jgi:D-alanine-D-alanine ligase
VRIAVLYNDDRGIGAAAVDRAAVEGVRGAALGVEQALRTLGHEPVSIAVRGDPAELVFAIRAARPEIVFNLIESVAGSARLESAAAWLLEWLGVPFTGNAPEVLSLALDKPLAKAILKEHGVPVARGVLLESGHEPLTELPAPWIVKPARLDASHGIDRDSVTSDPDRARAKAEQIRERYGDAALVEEYIEGRELNVSIVAGEALPPGEIDFDQMPADRPRILTYDAKWNEASPEYEGTPAIAARSLDDGLRDRLISVSKSTYRALGLRGYGRVDLRLHPERGPVVLEVNPNPDLSPDAGLARAGERGGFSYAQLIGRILDEALARSRASTARSSGS